MPSKGKHRRIKSISLTRGLAAAGTGAAVLALPVLGATTASAAQAAPAAKSAAAPATYVVTAGDTLSKIAREHSLSGGWKKLYQDNRATIGDNPGLIYPGAKLTLGKKSPAKPADTRAYAERADRSEVRTTLAAAPAPSWRSPWPGARVPCRPRRRAARSVSAAAETPGLRRCAR
ncbi:LysM peptidoglycan-binding domain-containing protein [Streptomyces sp. NPDC001939]